MERQGESERREKGREGREDDEVEESFSLEKNRAREKKRDREKETGNAATKDSNCSAGDNVNFCAVGAVRRATKLCPVLHEDRLVLGARDPLPRPPLCYTKLPSPARCVSLHSRQCPMSARGGGREGAPLPRMHLHLRKPAEFLYR